MSADFANCRTETIGFYLVPGFAMLSFASALEPLRIANRLSGRELYRWPLYSLDGRAVCASNGLPFQAERAIDEVAPPPDALIVVSGVDAKDHCGGRLISWLRRLGRAGVNIGATSIGSVILARAGLLNGYRCTVHWENLAGLREEFPGLSVTEELFELDRRRWTCSGGTAGLDMMLHLIEARHGHDLAVAVAEQCIHPHIREGREAQRMTLRRRLDVSHPKLLVVIELMQGHLEQPLTCEDLAGRASLTLRQLERVFRRELATTPGRYYLRLRLERARDLLRQTSLSVFDVATACGFASASHFSKCYRLQFGVTPREARRPAAVAPALPPGHTGPSNSSSSAPTS